ncbi:hypothetical protein MTR_0077s0090 [Medicago truncatula]|uniref:Uncharacterized protein n=1 Tax=Medicago truncatula TaxID=3880 RepID=A0A072THJ3_MEDTR|nr:hypothetical protein MTR_0077s0090 [Medicago truncatula]
MAATSELSPSKILETTINAHDSTSESHPTPPKPHQINKPINGVATIEKRKRDDGDGNADVEPSLSYLAGAPYYHRSFFYEDMNMIDEDEEDENVEDEQKEKSGVGGTSLSRLARDEVHRSPREHFPSPREQFPSPRELHFVTRHSELTIPESTQFLVRQGESLLAKANIHFPELAIAINVPRLASSLETDSFV